MQVVNVFATAVSTQW